MEKRTVVGWTIVMAVTGALLAQNTAVKRTVVTRGDVSVPGREAVITNVRLHRVAPLAGTPIQAMRSVMFWRARGRS
jgi:hypothetical protein